MKDTITIKSTPRADRSIQINDGDELTLAWTDRVFISSGGGFGCAANARGNAVYGHWKDTGRDDRVERYDVTCITQAPNSPEFVKFNKLIKEVVSLESSIDTHMHVFKEKSKELNELHRIDFLYELDESYDSLSETMKAIIKYVSNVREVK